MIGPNPELAASCARNQHHPVECTIRDYAPHLMSTLRDIRALPVTGQEDIR